MHFMPLNQVTAEPRRFGIFTGTLIDIQERLDTNNNLFYRLVVSDGMSSIYGNVWASSPLYVFVQILNSDEMLRLELKGQIFCLGSQLMCSVQDINISCGDEPSYLGVHSVPIRAREAFVWLERYIHELPFLSLKHFLTQVFEDPAIADGFFSSRASANNHHSFAGGLLVHSVEVAKLVDANAQLLKLSDYERHISIVVALLHDLGKVQTVGEKNPRPRSATLFRHEAQTLILVAQHISALAKESVEAADLIEHLLGRLTACDKFKSVFVGEDLVRHADQASAAAGVGKRYKDFEIANTKPSQ